MNRMEIFFFCRRRETLPGDVPSSKQRRDLRHPRLQAMDAWDATRSSQFYHS